jgi:hypothetical protein
MRYLHHEFFGALLGAWVGVTIILGASVEPHEIVIFLFAIVLMAVALDLAFADRVSVSPPFRAVGVVTYISLTIFFPITFRYFPWLQILTDKQAIFVFFLLLFWFICSLATSLLTHNVTRPMERV